VLSEFVANGSPRRWRAHRGIRERAGTRERDRRPWESNATMLSMAVTREADGWAIEHN